jgi:hypothetical protein
MKMILTEYKSNLSKTNILRGKKNRNQKMQKCRSLKMKKINKRNVMISIERNEQMT